MACSNKPFKRKGVNLYNTEANDLFIAVLVGNITLATFDGKVKLHNKPGTQNGVQVKLKGKGFPIYKKEGEFGDLIISWNIKIPVDLSEK